MARSEALIGMCMNKQAPLLLLPSLVQAATSINAFTTGQVQLSGYMPMLSMDASSLAAMAATMGTLPLTTGGGPYCPAADVAADAG